MVPQWFEADEIERQRLTALSKREVAFTVLNADGSAQELRRPLIVSNHEDHQRIAVYIVFDSLNPNGSSCSTLFLYIDKDLSRTIIESADRTHLILPQPIQLTAATAL